METPLARLQFEVWEIQFRFAKRNQLDWCMGGRSDPNADGTLSAKLQSPPRGLPRARLRGILGVSLYPRQVGYPASTNTDASLGHSVAGYQFAALAYQSCVAQKSLLVRLDGRTTHERREGRKGLA